MIYYQKFYKIWAVWVTILGLSLFFFHAIPNLNSFVDYFNAFITFDFPSSWCPTFLTLYGISSLLSTKFKPFFLLSKLSGALLLPIGLFVTYEFTFFNSGDPFTLYIYAQTIHISEILTGIFTLISLFHQQKIYLLIAIPFLASLALIPFFTKNLSLQSYLTSSKNYSYRHQPCISNQNPVFTHDITDLSQIKMIVPPGSIETYEGNKIVKSHSYVLVNQQVPVYAPTDGTLVEAAYYYEEGNVYYLHFQVSCEVTYRFDHIINPINEIKNALPSKPAQTTHTMEPKTKVKIKAGQLIGYSVPHTPFDHGIWFDFGVVNTSQKTNLSHLEKQNFKLDERDYQSVCPYDFFSPSMKQKYYSLFNNYKDNGTIPVLYCK